MKKKTRSVTRRIIVLNPFPAVPSRAIKPEKKLRVAAYCRVSSSSDEQLVSYQNQVQYYQHTIQANPSYELIGIFADEGVSGTGLRQREEFNRLMQTARDGKLDLIITKSLSRFGRNTLDCLMNIRELKSLGVDVYFERENVHVLRSEGEMLLTLIAAVAQNESLNQSENVKWGIRRQYERGNIKSVQASKFLGYIKDRQGDLVIDEAQAVTVRRIYQLFFDGLGVYQIAKFLTDENVPMVYGGKKWTPSHILKVLTNEKYMGDTRFQKTFNADYLTKRRVKNTGQLPQYYRENTHPAIICRETWELVQLEMARQKQFVESHQMDKFHHHSQEIPLSGKIICGECGRILLLRETNRATYENSKFWRCVTRHGSDNSCGSQLRLDVDAANQSLVRAWNELIGQPDHLDQKSYSKLIIYRRNRLKALLQEHGPIKVMPYDLLPKVLDHIEVHTDYLTIIFLAGIRIRVDLCCPNKLKPRWTHTRKEKSKLARQRMTLGLTQEELAKQVGVARAYLNRVENGVAVPSVELVQRLSRVIGPIDGYN